MGRIFQIRVMAYTYSEEDVRKRWPELFKLAFGKEKEGPAGSRGRGVLELAQVLEDKQKFADLEDKIREALKEPVQDLHQKILRLESSLSERNPQEADKISYELEDILDGLERKISSLL